MASNNPDKELSSYINCNGIYFTFEWVTNENVNLINMTSVKM